MRRKAVAVFAGAIGLVALLGGNASALGPGGWDNLGERPPAGSGIPSLSGGRVDSMNTDSGNLIVGGDFNAINQAPGATLDDDHVAIYDGRTWSTLGAGSGDISVPTSTINALEFANGKIYAGGTFIDAGPSDADALAVWDTNNPGAGWQPPCGSATAFTSNVHALLIDGNTLYIGGAFENAGGIPEADGAVACNLTTGAITAMTDDSEDICCNVNAIVKAPNGKIYLGGNFGDVNGILAADYVVEYTGGTSWSSLGGAAAIDTGVGVDALAVDASSNLYVGTEDLNVAGIAEADCIARWNGSAWSALGSNGAGNGYLPPNGTVTFCGGEPGALAVDGSDLYVFGTYLNAGGDPLADELTRFNTATNTWSTVGSNGAGNGAFSSPSSCSFCHGIAIFHGKLHVGGNFQNVGADPLADSIACFALGSTPCIEAAPVVTQPGASIPTPTGQRAAALAKCKKKKAKLDWSKKRYNRCRKQANQLPV